MPIIPHSLKSNFALNSQKNCISKMNTIFLILAVAILGVSAQEGVPCHNKIFQMTPRHTLNISEFMGKWYLHEYASSNIGNTPDPPSCMKMDLAHQEGNPLNITSNEFWIENGVDFTDVTSIAVNDTRSPMSSLWYGTSFDGDTQIDTDMIVMAADLEFNNWMMLYQCTILNGSYRWETMGVYSRNTAIPSITRNWLKALMVGSGFRIGDHKPISQDQCPP